MMKLVLYLFNLFVQGAKSPFFGEGKNPLKKGCFKFVLQFNNLFICDIKYNKS